MKNTKNILNINQFSIINKYQDFYLIKNDIIYKIIIEKNKNEIIIKSNNNYIKVFNLNELSILFKYEFYSINNAYEYIINKFEENKVSINNKIINKEIILKFKIKNKQEVDIILNFNQYNNDLIFNEINKLKNEIRLLKIENNNLMQEVEKLKKFHDNKVPKEIKLLSEINNNSYSDYGLDNTFTIFTSINDFLYLIYSTKSKSIICQDLIDQKTVIELKNCHDEYITNLRHYLDKNNKRDIVMSISNADNNLKLWNVNNFECILNILNVNEKGHLYSACFMAENDQNYIISSNYNEINISKNLQIFDFNGNKMNEIINSNEATFFVDTYYDDILNKNYIITANLNYVKSYDYNNNKLYHKYNDNGKGYHFSIKINNSEPFIKLIESCEDGNIRIWNFHSGKLLNKIKIIDDNLNGICLWNNNYLFIGCDDETIKLIDLKNEIIITELIGHNKPVLTIKTIIHPKIGECLISQGYEDDQIKIWILKS